MLSGQHGIADAQGARLNQHIGHVSSALVEAAFHHRAQGPLLRIGLEVEQFGLEQDLLKQLVDVGAKLGRDFLTLVLPSPILDENVHLSKLLLDSIWVRRVSVHLVDGENHRDFRGLGVVDGLLGLGHDPVVGRHDNDGQICDLCTPCTHRGERLVTWRVQEGHFLAAFQLYSVSTNVLGDATCLTCDDVGFAHKVKQRGFAVVDVSHHGHNRRARNQIVFCILLNHNGLLDFGTHKLNFKTKFFGDDGDGF